MRSVLAIALIAISLAGCAGDEPEPEPVAVDEDPFTLDAEARDLRTDMTADDAAPAPAWAIGDWFGHHLFFGATDTSGTHINTVVTEDRGGQWFLATDDPDVARWEAAWDFPMLGTIGKDLSTTAFAADWNIYEFPMTDGNTWTSSIDPLFNGPRDVTFTATFNGEITTPYGVRPGFDIVGTNEDGAIEIMTDYVPEIGWYSRLILFDTSTEDLEDFILDIRAMGRGNDWTGTYHVAEAIPLLTQSGFVSVFAPQAASPDAAGQFTITADGQELYGIAVTFAATGVSDAELVGPNGEHYSFQAMHTSADGFAQSFQFVEEDAVAGDWSYTWAGAGAVAGSFLQLWEIQFTATPMA